MRMMLIALLFTVITFAAGCGESMKAADWDQVTELTGERNLLRQKVGQLEGENGELREQVKTLSSLDPNVRLEMLNRLKKIEIGKRSGIYDKDKDGKVEKLIVYVKPFDDSGDAFKAAGKVEVELWDLNAESAKAKIGQWKIKPAELKKLWSSVVITNYYRLAFDVGDIISQEQEELTVKIKFIDYITGKIFNEQRVVSQTK